MLTDIILAAPAGIALPADELGTAGHFLPGTELRHFRTDGGDYAGILMPLHDRIDRTRMGPVIGMDLAATNPDMHDIEEDFIPFQVFGFRRFNVRIKNDFVGLLQNDASHTIDFSGFPE